MVPAPFVELKSYWICGVPGPFPATLFGCPRLVATVPVGSLYTWRRYAPVLPLSCTLPSPSGPLSGPPRYGVLVGFINSTQNRTRAGFVGMPMSVVFSDGSLVTSLYA